MSKHKILLSTLFAAVAVIILLGILEINLSHKNQALKDSLADPFAGAKSRITSVTFPIPLSNNSVKSVYLSYLLIGTVKSIEKKDNKTLLVTEDFDHIPNMSIDPKTALFFDSKTGQTNATVYDIKPQMRVGLAANYNVVDHTWLLSKVFILK